MVKTKLTNKILKDFSEIIYINTLRTGNKNTSAPCIMANIKGSFTE